MMPTVLLLCAPLPVAYGSLASAQVAGELPRLPEVVITGERLLRLEEAASQLFITPDDIRLQPPARPGNILRQVPRFVTIDHSGGGVKADQHLLCGLDADYAADVAFFFSAAFWLLYLNSELVFVGDEGVTEAGDANRRMSYELFTRIKLLDWLWVRGDLTAAMAEFRGTLFDPAKPD